MKLALQRCYSVSPPSSRECNCAQASFLHHNNQPWRPPALYGANSRPIGPTMGSIKTLGLLYRRMSPALHAQCHEAIEMASDFNYDDDASSSSSRLESYGRDHVLVH
mmetsp:Transcript_24832/g.52632  ORF Transcript_24832/g.52632 Transcript_24832/m.52632 type:complete len:107 (+) Transcript_24832:2154-2474(+)